jgi:hypothetical protein
MPLKKRGAILMKTFLVFMGILGLWVLLQAYILPKLGIST